MRERSFALRAHSRSLTYPFTQKLGHSRKERSLAYEGLDFTIDHLIGIRAPGRIKQGATYLSITPIENDFDLSRVADLMKLLIKTGVLYETEECFEVQ